MKLPEIKKEYIRKTFRSRKKWNQEQVAEELISELKLDLSVEDVICIGIQPYPDEVKEFVAKHNLICDRCNTSQYIVAEAVGFDERGGHSRIEYFCVKPTGGIFSKCWNHVYAYGKDGVGHKINKVTRCSES